MTMRRGTKVLVKQDTISQFVRSTMTTFQMFNEATVCKWNKKDQRVMIKWDGQYEMWFDFDQVEIVLNKEK
jgi:hypothetical protein